MKRQAAIITIVCFSTLLGCFFVSDTSTPEDKIKEYYNQQFKLLSQKLDVLQSAVEQDKNEKTIHESFLQARLAYKSLELFVEYYMELDVFKFNGLAIDFIEEEDPEAYHEPQGFQMIETFIYPRYDKTKKEALLDYIHKLVSVTNGISNNTLLFNPDEYLLDATTEELYRVLSLGISGFDSPIAQLSLPETKASLQSIQLVLQAYKDEILQKEVTGYDSTMNLLTDASAYLDKHNNFNRFNRMEFITRFLNPVCTWLSTAKTKMGYHDNPSRYTLIKKTGFLFDEKSLQLNTYLFDDTVTAARVELGKRLFYEPLLSANGKRSCAGCHHPDKGFTDGLPTALQIDGHTALARNTPTLWNASLQKNLFHDSRQGSLNRLVIEVLGNDKEMNNSADNAGEKIIHQKEYAGLYKKAFPYADTTMTGNKIATAIAMYVRTLISYNSRFDQYMRGDKSKMTTVEIKGFNLFMGKAKCATCHYVPLFNGSKPPTYYYQESEVIGVPATADPVHPVLDGDMGRYAILKKDFFKHAFKTPTLRNVELTAPYMHNGVYKTLKEVIDFYDKGGGKGLGIDVPNQTLPEDKLHLTKPEKKQLIAFLKTLTDTTGR